MTGLSHEQKAVVDAPLMPLAVVACAGSGKTRTAVRRLAEIRRQLGGSRAYVALLSFSNVAVETFRSDYAKLAQQLPAGFGGNRVCIETVDSFISRSVLLPHAYRTMGSKKAAYLVSGSEPFLNSFKFWVDKLPKNISELKVGVRANEPYFYYDYHGNISELDFREHSSLVARMGEKGAYTFELGRYWAYQTLRQQPAILKALAHRYPHILVDEAQDIGALHQAILELLISAGVRISLIGDPNQAIYEFAGADGSFLNRYAMREGTGLHSLTMNYRSVPAILSIANAVSMRKDEANRAVPKTMHGAFFIAYAKAGRRKLVDAFQATVAAAGLDCERSAVVSRAKDVAEELRGTDAAHGEGLVKGFVAAALWRDARNNYFEAFKSAANCIVPLLEGTPEGTLNQLGKTAQHPEVKSLRRLIWSFVRDSNAGLPSAALIGDKEWHPALLKSVKALLFRIHDVYGYEPAKNLGTRLRNRKLPDTPFLEVNLVADGSKLMRIDTVHQTKGESLDAVLYIASKAHVRALIDGVGTEDGRIGYVAVTRAKDLFWLGIPHASIKNFRDELISLGFQELPSAANG
jgi:hypothetical protein